MITLFRKIRKQLLAKGNLTSYLLYAAGEILLVMIGILLALQVNNWNETRKTRQATAKALVDLKLEFEESLPDLQKLIKETQQVEAEGRDYFKKLAQRKAGDGSVQLGRGELYWGGWRHSNKILHSLFETGSIEKIENDSLKILLTRWLEQSNNLIEWDHTMDDFRNNTLRAYMREKVPDQIRLENGQLGYLLYEEKEVQQMQAALMEDLIFQNYFKTHINMLWIIRGNAKRMEQLHGDIMTLLTSQLEMS